MSIYRNFHDQRIVYFFGRSASAGGDPEGTSTRGERAMKRRIVWLSVVFVPLLLLVARNAQGATVFTEDVTFVDGDVYRSVEIHEDAHAEVLGGRFDSRFQLYDDATATLRGGNFRGIFSVGDSSRATIHPDTSINTYIFMSGSAELDIFGGRMPDRFLDAAAWGGDPRVTFHGYDLFLDPTGGSQGDGLVTGVFANGNAFAVHLRGAETASRVRLAEMKYPAQIVDNIGLFHVCYKLSLLGWNAMPTSRNARGIDAISFSMDGNRMLTFQVKTLSKKSPVSVGTSLDKIMGDFWIIVNDAASDSPKCYVLLPHEVRALATKREKNGQVSYWLQLKSYAVGEFEERWSRIGYGMPAD